MTWRQLNLCVADERNYCALMGLMGRMIGRVAARVVIAFAFAPTSASAASADVTGVVAGVQSPAAGRSARAGRAGDREAAASGCARATAFIDGELEATGPFPDGACRANDVDPPPCPSTISAERRDRLPLSDGDHVLRWWSRTWTAACGRCRRSSSRSTTRRSCSTHDRDGVDRLGRDRAAAVGQRAAAAPSGGARGCASPRLSMFLAQRPLRFVRGVPVLARRPALPLPRPPDLPRQRTPASGAAGHAHRGPQPRATGGPSSSRE